MTADLTPCPCHGRIGECPDQRAARLALSAGLRRVELAAALAERDRARDVAVALEQEYAHLREVGTRAVSAVAHLAGIYDRIVMDTTEDRELHRRVTETTWRAITVARVALETPEQVAVRPTDGVPDQAVAE